MFGHQCGCICSDQHRVNDSSRRASTLCAIKMCQHTLVMITPETTDGSNSTIKGCILLLNIPTAGMPIYAHPLGFVLGDAHHCATTPPGEQRQITLRLHCHSIGKKFPQHCPFHWGHQGPHLTHSYLGAPNRTHQTPFRSTAPSPPQNCPFPWGSGRPFNT